MKKLTLIFLLYLLSQNLTAQTFSVGNTCCNYNLVNYNFTPSSGCVSYTLDINGDTTPDINVYSCFVTGMSASSPWYNGIRAVSSNSVEFVYGPSVITICYPPAVIKNVPFGTVLDASLNWSLTPTSSPGPEPDVNWWYSIPATISYSCGEQTNAFYIAFRKVMSCDTIYGWILMDSNKPGKIFSYAYTCGTCTSSPQSSTITTAALVMCKGDSISLNANPGGGVFYGPGVSGNYFKTKNLSAGVYTINYVIPNPNGCTTSPSSVTFTVLAASITNTQTAICSGESLTLTANPSGGIFSGTYISGDVFSPLSAGNFAAIYSYTNSTGCTITTSVNLISNACVGVNELTLEDNIFKVFPNPNAGEFEVRGVRKTTIKITNELGQLVKTVELNSGNNFSSKITDLQNGVYFIGNNFSRQKIVVIR